MSLLRRRMMMSVKEPDVPTDELDYLTIIPLHDEEETYKINVCQGSESESWFPEYSQLAPLYYRVNSGEWLEFMFEGSTTGDTIYFNINLKKGDELQLKCTTYDLKMSDYSEFYPVTLFMKHKFNVRGTPMSLVYGEDFKENIITPDYRLNDLFYGSGITKILNPKTFLPCTVLEENCYINMFYGCTNLVNAPELPATTLADGCYRGMFYYCTSLITAPDLPATTLTVACYDYMFYGCTNLNFIKMLATDISADYCLRNWVNGVSSTGTFVKHPDMTSLPTGVDGIPEGWTVVNDGEEEGGNNFGIEFPLYLEFDECSTIMFTTIECIRYADDISIKLHEVLKDVINQYGESDVVTGQILELLSIEIYIENSKVTGMELQPMLGNMIFMYTEDRRGADLYNNGNLIQNYSIIQEP